MRISDAFKAMENCGYLTVVERAVFMALLIPSDHGTCELPERYTRSVPRLATSLSLKVRAVQYAVVHLERHGWVTRDVRRGRGRKTRYRLVPRTPDCECHCQEKMHDGARIHSQENVHDGARIRGGKGARGCTGKGARDDDVSAGQPTNDADGIDGREEMGTQNTSRNVTAFPRPKCAVSGCTQPARRACRTCAGHMAEEMTAGLR